MQIPQNMGRILAINAMKKSIIVLFFIVCSFSSAYAQVYNILTYKAVADGKTNNTSAIQKAVDDCASHGGGTVWVPPGTYVTGMIKLKSNVNFHLEMGSVLQALADGTKYISLILIQEVQNVSITGPGTLFGNGKNFLVQEAAPDRPYIIFAKDSKNISIENVHLLHSAAWALRLYGCQVVKINGISIYSHANFNNDGIDIDSKDVIVSNCIIDTGDDAICLKSDDPKRPTENITISNCIAASNCNAIKMGTSSYGGYKNITISNCVLRAASESPLHHWNADPKNYINDRITGISGIALEIVDGGLMEQVSISNITMTGIQTPIFIRLGSRANPTGSLRNVLISNITATSKSRMSSTIAAVPGYYIENVTLRDIMIKTEGRGTMDDVNRKVPEDDKGYPENRMFGWSLPAHGLYVRHVKNLRLNNVQFTLSKPDVRPAIWLEDVHQFHGDGIQTPKSATNWLKQVNTTEVLITNHTDIK